MARRNRRRIGGQSAIETLIALPVLLAMVGGALQLTLLYRAKLVLNQAAFQAARAGALSEGDPWAIHEALAEGLAPLYGTPGAPSRTDRYLAARLLVAEVQTLSWVQVERLSPTLAAFDDYGDAIPNSHLRYREPDTSASQTIQDANQLRLRVVYCHPLQVPLVDRTIVAMVGPDLAFATREPDVQACRSEPDFERRCYCAHRLPIETQALVRMQSDGAKIAPPPEPGG